MSLITIPYTFTPFTTAYSAQVNSNFSTIATAINGNLDNTNIGSAGIYASQIIPTNSTQATFGGSVSYKMTTAPIFSSLTGYLYANGSSAVTASTSIPTSALSGTISLTSQVTGTLPVANGGSGTSTPSLVAGSNVTITGTWPNQTIAATSSGTITSVTASSPLASSGGTTPNISISSSTGSGAVVLATAPTFPTQVFHTVQSSNPSFVSAGQFWYDQGNDSLAYYNSTGYEINLGQEVDQVCYNNTGSTIPAGTAVYLSGGSSGNAPYITPAIATSISTANMVGVTGQSIANGATGVVVILGGIFNYNTTGISAGTTLYLSSSTAGALTSTQPISPYYAVRAGFVIVGNSSSGIIFVSVRNVYTLGSNIISPVTLTAFSTSSAPLVLYGYSSSQIADLFDVWTYNGGTKTFWISNTGVTTMTQAPILSSLTGYLYGNGSSAVTASTTIPFSAISGTVSTTNALTVNSSGTGGASPQSFNGSSAVTISYNTVGASPLAGSTSLTTVGTITTGTWNAGSVTTSGSFVAGSSTYGPTSATVNGNVTIGSSGSNAILSANTNDLLLNSGSGAYLVAINYNSSSVGGLAVYDGGTSNHSTLTSSGLTVGTSTYGATSATVNGGITATSLGAPSGSNLALNAPSSGIISFNINSVQQGYFNGSQLILTTPILSSQNITPGYAGSGGTSTIYSGTGTPSFSAYAGSLYLSYSGTGGGLVYYNSSGAGTSGTSWTALGGGGGTTTNSLTMNSSGSGATSGTTFNGSAAQTISYNTIGAAPLASPTFTGSVTSPAFVATETITGSLTAGAFSYGTLPYSDTGLTVSANLSTTTYSQMVLSNSNSGSGASADFIVSNNLGTASTYYGDLGINSSTFTGTGSFNLANATYLYSANGDLVLGTQTSNGIHLVVNNGSTDSLAISSSGTVSLPAFTTAGVVLNSASGVLSSSAGPLAIANGGTNSTATPTAGGVGYGTGTAHAYTSAGTSGQPLLSAGASAPAFGNLNIGTANTNVTGTLTITNGGTGQSTASAAFNALSPITSTGDLIIGNGTNSATRLAIGANTYVLTSNGTTASWAAPTGGASLSANNTWTGTQTFSGTSSVLAATFANMAENITVSATAATGTINLYTATQSILYYTTNATGNFTINVAHSSGTTLNTAMATGTAITVVFMNTNGTTAYYCSAMNIDGTAQTVKWLGNIAPAAGNPSLIDFYTFTIIKTASATYTVFGSMTTY